MRPRQYRMEPRWDSGAAPPSTHRLSVMAPAQGCGAGWGRARSVESAQVAEQALKSAFTIGVAEEREQRPLIIDRID